MVSLFTVVLYSDAIYSALFPQDLSFSTEARLLAYRYFPTHAGDMGAFGIGFIPNGSPYAVLINVDLTTGRGGVDDIGIVEYYARFGLMGVFVLIFAVASFVAEFRRSPKNLCVFEESAEAWMALAYFLALAPTMAITDPQRIFYLPYIVLMVEHTLVAKSIR